MLRPLIIRKTARQPIRPLTIVPAGMPIDRASGVPTMARAMARPLRRSGAMRLA